MPVFGLIPNATDLAQHLVDVLRERRAGPETDETRAMRMEIAHLKAANSLNDARIEELEERRYELRRAARGNSWWLENQPALTVNIVASLIVGIPILIVGTALGYLLAR